MNNKEVEQEHIKMQDKFNEYRAEYGHPPENFKMVAVGYLDISEPFEKGEVSQNFLNKLKILWDEGGAAGSLGFHECQHCIAEDNYENRARSNYEKTLVDKYNNIKYLLPEMIFHYITAHKFKPCNEFIEFVMMGN